ncbi:MAG: Phospho-2-dehydro-3-deoxyheptonate aldolase [Chloroflexi bacterium]|nr:Phospho-2-dehydro-3-deoxyheptonate aldolase [Chloroflexota bacterium]
MVKPHTKNIPISPEIRIGGKDIIFIAGPCAIESYRQARDIAMAMRKAGLHIMRGGAFKPRTSPHTFQGLGKEGLEILRQVADEFGLLVITEALSVEHLPLVMEYADIIQIGSRNMQHFPLLWAVGETEKPVMLKRGFMSTVEEWLLAAKHITTRGNPNIILCERGIRTASDAGSNTLDVNAIALLKETCPYPVIADPSHGTGRSDLVLPAAKAALAAGADGLMVEFHPHPPQALSDKEQAVALEVLPQFVEEMRALAGVLGREIV